MRADLDLTNFTAGELSPRLAGRPDIAKYFNGCESLFNFVVLPQGGAARRPGTKYVAAVADQTAKPRLVPFQFSTLQPYMLEFGPGYCRFYTSDGQIVSGGAPVQIAPPYQEADLPALRWVQSADTLFLTHPSYPMQLLTRQSNTAWSIAAAVFRDGPYLDVNTTATQLTPSANGAAGASITLTASSTAGINNGAGFSNADIGRHVRLNNGSLWSWLIITAVSSTTVVTATVQPANPNGAQGGLDGQAWQASTAYLQGAVVVAGSVWYQANNTGISGPTAPTATGTAVQDGTIYWTSGPVLPLLKTRWQLGKWTTANGYPWLPTFWQERLTLAGTNNQPNAIELSVVGDFYNFAPTQADGTVTDANAMSWIITDDEVNAARWLSPAGSAQAMQLGIGTTGGESIMQGANGGTLTPLSVQAYRETKFGGAPNLQAIRIAKAVLFAGPAAQKVHEWTFQWMVNGYVGPDLAVLSQHITQGGIAVWDWQQDPLGIVWMAMADGALAGMTYLRDQDVVAWHRHQLGGQYYGGPPIVEGLACAKANSGQYDELWLAVLRTIDGVPTRTIEVMAPYWGTSQPAPFPAAPEPLEDAWYLDCAIQSTLPTPAGTAQLYGSFAAPAIDQPPVLSGIGTVITSAPVLGAATEGQMLRLNGGVATITGSLNSNSGGLLIRAPFINAAPAQSGDWTLAVPTNRFSGIGYLSGETLGVFADGEDLGTQPTAGGQESVTLPVPATLVTVGLPYASALVTMPAEPGRSGGVAQGRIKRIDTIYARFLHSVGGSVGIRLTDPVTQASRDFLEPIQPRYAQGQMDAPPPVFTGIRRLKPPGGADMEARMLVTQTGAMPMTVLAIGAGCDIEELAQP